MQVIAGLVTITVIKLILAACWGWTNDIPQTLAQAEAFLHSPHVLRPESPAIFPLGYYWFATAPLLASMWTGLSYAFWLKVPAILADALIALTLRTMSRGGDRIAFLYLVNPVSFLLSVYHGQLHTVATAGAVLALWYAERHRRMASGVALGLSASVRQHFGFLILPLILASRTRRVVIVAGFSLVTLLANATLFGTYRPGIVASPVWAYGAWGYGMLALQGPRLLEWFGFEGMVEALANVNQWLQTYGPRVYWVWAAVFLGWVWRRHQRNESADLWREGLVFLLGLYVVSPGFGVQWLIWVLPFWLLVNRRAAVRYSLVAGLFLAGAYWQAGLNAKYGLGSITANLPLLQRADLVGVLLVGVCGLLTWLYCVRAVWQLARTDEA